MITFSGMLEHMRWPVETGAERKHDYIDAVRGWAILLVITSHVGWRFGELPFPVQKLTYSGAHGVQMFFMASAVTLMMSWQRQKETGWTATRHFFIRRYLRIAPMYYIGALFYFIAEPPDSGFDLMQMLRSFLFVNSWHPQWIPTTPGWTVVPGGWSIGVEFTFYALFPILATLLITLPRALLFAVATLVLAVVTNEFGSIWLKEYGEIAVSRFLYFWFPNQAPIFAFGIILYHLLARAPLAVWIGAQSLTYGTLAVIILACVYSAEHPTSPFIFMPSVYINALLFMAFIFVLAKGTPTIFTHPWMRRLGTISFSAYLLHFFFVFRIPGWTGGLIDTKATGFAAIGMCALLWITTMISTVATATLAHILIEQPGINLARRLTSRQTRKDDRVACLGQESS